MIGILVVMVIVTIVQLLTTGMTFALLIGITARVIFALKMTGARIKLGTIVGLEVTSFVFYPIMKFVFGKPISLGYLLLFFVANSIVCIIATYDETVNVYGEEYIDE